MTQADFTAIDTELAACIHEGGGTWAPSAVITIGGSGLTCSGPFASSGTATITGPVNANAQTTTVNGGTVALVGSSLTVDATSNITTAVGALVTCNGSTTFNGTVTHNDNFSLNSAKVFSCAGTIALGTTGVLTGGAGALVNFTGSGIVLGAGTTVLNSGIFANAAAGRTQLRYSVVSGAGATLSVANADCFLIPNLAAAEIYVLTSTGAVNNDCVEIYAYRNIGTFHASIRDDSNVEIASMRANTTGDKFVAKYVFLAGVWEQVSHNLLT